MIWAKVSGVNLVYYAQDNWNRVKRGLKVADLKGGMVLRLIRSPLEAALIWNSNLLAVVSETIRNDFIDSGIDPTRVITCELPRHRTNPDLAKIEDWRKKVGIREEVPIVFVGNLSYPPNRRATDFIIGTLVPAIGHTRRAWKVLLAGAGTAELKSPDPRVVGLGPVDDLDSLLYISKIGIAPMEVEGGVSGKLVDYLTHGLLSIATPEAASGVARCDELIIADIAEFATKIRSYLQDDRFLPSGYERPIDPNVSLHYFSSPGITALADWCRETRARERSDNLAASGSGYAKHRAG
ncbi:MAG: glycosyltransferase family 4 protein [Thermoplasmata archaeon]